MMPQKNTTIFYRTLLALALVAISYLATTSTDIPVVDRLNDKLSHLAAFFALSLLIDLSWPLIAFVAVKLPGLLAYGILIEIVQHFLPRRAASGLDLAADAIGILLYLGVTPVVRRIAPFVARSRS